MYVNIAHNRVATLFLETLKCHTVAIVDRQPSAARARAHAEGIFPQLVSQSVTAHQL